MGMENFLRSSLPISLLVHLLVLAIAWFLMTVSPPKEAERWVEIDLQDNQRRAIVETHTGQKAEPVRDAFLGKENRKVEEEKVAKLREAQTAGGALKTFKNMGAPLIAPGAGPKAQDTPQFSDFRQSFGDPNKVCIDTEQG
jgi:hypothetical protein